MLAKERLARIRQLLVQNGKVHVSELCNIFNVSEDLIRKDLKVLERQGLIERIYGGALLREETDLNRQEGIFRAEQLGERMSKYAKSNEILAEKGFNLIENGDVVYMDTSSSNVVLAQKLAQSGKRLTVISHSLLVLGALIFSPGITIICPGGQYSNDVAGLTGANMLSELGSFYVDKAFVGVVALETSTGSLMVDAYDDAQIKRKLMTIGREVIIPCHAHKLGRKSTYKFGNLAQVDKLLTDTLSQEERKSLSAFGTQLL